MSMIIVEASGRSVRMPDPSPDIFDAPRKDGTRYELVIMTLREMLEEMRLTADGEPEELDFTR